MNTPHKKHVMSLFCIDGGKDTARGFTDGTYWNEWAKPKFLLYDIVEWMDRVGWKYKISRKQADLILSIYDEASDEWNEFIPTIYDTYRLGKVLLYELHGYIWDDIRDWKDR